MLYFVRFRPLFVFANAVLLCLAYAIIIFDPVSLDKTNNLAIFDMDASAIPIQTIQL